MNTKINGLIFGQALGDAIGLTTEFMDQNDITNIYSNNFTNYNFEMIHNDYHRSNWKKGDWTDDTDQFLLILQMISEKNIEIKNFSKKLIKWISNGIPECDDIKSYGLGNTLSIWWGDTYSNSNPLLAGLRCWIYHPYFPLSNSSNGSLMRTSILGVLSDQKIMFEKTIEMSAITHPDPKCILSCLFVTNIIYNIIYQNLSNFDISVYLMIIDEIKPEFLNYCDKFNHQIKNWKLENDEFKEIIELNLQNFQELNPILILDEFKNYIQVKNYDDIKLNENIGYCFKPIGCLCLILSKINTLNYLELIIELMSKGGDADTNCAIVGGVLGCYYGYDKLPIKLIEQIPYLHYLKIQVLNLYNSLNL
jgi:ADP-ribosylglycohydrolase